MSIDRELQRRRWMAIRDILKEGEPDLEELVKRLRELGIPATKANVRRDLKALKTDSSRLLHISPARTERADEPPFQRAQGMILRLTTVESSMILMKTRPRAGPLVGTAIDESHWEEVAGTIAGDSTVLLVCARAFAQAAQPARPQGTGSRYLRGKARRRRLRRRRAAQAAPPAAVAEPVLPHETFTIDSKALGEVRRINVYTPPGYAAAAGGALRSRNLFRRAPTVRYLHRPQPEPVVERPGPGARRRGALACSSGIDRDTLCGNRRRRRPRGSRQDP